ncbi:radical SAM superfamily enzyme YgiQ (UPF0313 family) [Geothermobacter ehrlichii]|uniref:Radical SAM superfamily enzyme YgiQ (UPF0313 family) n=1 Tax=Geothermobacter ehrlichii TaxID=213224 RepID=A0A5D3WF47_9BACT|nr:radical SAM protein [Geothermobacter ehrlichii]TYO96102.1 radical SAM superfamily enzyme YgiQ (UPF0313 family) [Geothermobacter ehrlichii]
MASQKLIKKARRRLAEETGCRANPWGGRLSVALVFPNTYAQAMSNLGFLTVYQLLNNREDCLAERFFLPDPADLREHRRTDTPLFSLESGRSLTDFDLVAFSISFENDYLNLPTLFELGRLPLWRRERTRRHPLVVCGGVCAFLNPEPLADIMDLFVVGEGEVILPPMLEVLQTGSGRQELLEELSRIPGVYVPAAYGERLLADGGRMAGDPLGGAPARVRRQWLRDLDVHPTVAAVQTRQTEFGDMYLMEVSRGCGRGCRFCAAGYLYLPPRERSLDRLARQAEQGLCHRERIGLVGAAVSDYSRLEELSRLILERQGCISVASLRIDSLTADEVATLHASGHKTLALAPEAGSQRLRDAINKQLTEEQILRAVDLLGEAGIQNLKLYFLVGLPGESEADLDETEALIAAIHRRWQEHGRHRGQMGRLILSVNPFIPKPVTPLQWMPLARPETLKRARKRLRDLVGRLANTELNFESPRSALLQAFLSRADRRAAGLLPDLAAGRHLEDCCREAGIDLAAQLYRERAGDEPLPWDIVDIGVDRAVLLEEYRRYCAGRLTPPCRPDCRRCGVCG